MSKFLLALTLLVGAAISSVTATSAPLKTEAAKPQVSTIANLDYADGVLTLPLTLGKTGKALVCPNPVMGICTESRLVTPEEAIKTLYPGATYLGIRLVRSERIDRLAIYYKTNQ